MANPTGGRKNINKASFVDVIRLFIWNSGGLSFYFACKWVLTILVVRFSSGFEDAGFLALAMSITNIAFCIAAYNVRTYQVSDITNEYKSSTYVTARLITVTAAFLLCTFYCLIFIGIDYRSVIVIVYMLLISGEAFSDVFQGMAQKLWRMDITGISLLVRGVVLIGVFTLLYIVSGLWLAILGSSIMTILVILLFEAKRLNKLEAFCIKFNWNELRKLLITCFPLMLVTLLYISFISIARISLENATNVETLGVFNSATILSILIVQLAGFIFVPLVNFLSKSLSEGNYKLFNNIFLLTCGGIIVISSVGIILTIVFGEQILRLLFGDDIVAYAHLLTESFFVAGLASLLSFLMTVLVVMRKIKTILLGCAAGVLCCISLSQWFLSSFGISGANYMQILGIGVSVGVLLIAYTVYFIRLRLES